MKKTQLISIPIMVVFIICFNNVAEAKIWRVNNFSNYNGTTLFGDNLGGTSTFPVFAQLSDANSSNLVSVNSTDTIHLEGTNIPYNGVTLHKPMIIIGTGYFLNENPKVSNTVLESQVGYVNFYSGSDGSQLIGIHLGSNSNPVVQINNISNITIKRCRIDFEVLVGAGNANISFIQNYFSNSNIQSAIFVNSTAGFPSNFIFDNNICKSVLLLSLGTTVYNAEECNNNVFDCPALSGNPSIVMTTSSFKNNILKTAAATVNINSNVSSSNVSYNISSSATGQFGTDNNNIVVTDMSTIFVNPATNSTDGDYQIAAGSVANNTGSDGTDRGAFGGAAFGNRYTLSGLAPIPVIYDIATPDPTSTDLPVTISARTIK